MLIKIQEPWWGAWKKFGWAKGIWGIGLEKGKVLESRTLGEPIFIEINGFKEKFRISPITVINYSEKNNTVFKARFKKTLYVVPQTELEKLK